MMESISVGLHLDEQIIDLKIPTRVTILRLKELLKEAVLLLGVQLPEKFELIVLNKSIVFVDYELLEYYPVGNGDQLKVVQR